MYVLIVDDEEGTRVALEKVLRKEGHRICLAFNGPAALEMMRSERPDLVLLDMLLPGIDGWEVARRKKLDPEIASIPMILVSGLSPREIHERAVEGASPLAGINVVLGKPIDAEQVRRAVHHIQELRGLEEETRS